jgi:hypothetical protein
MAKLKASPLIAIGSQRSDMWRKDIELYQSFSQGAMTKLNDVITTLEFLDKDIVTDFFLTYLDNFYNAICKERED